MTATVKVYIVETGCYEQRGISGVYASLEAAMEAHPVPDRPVRSSAATREREGGWRLVEGYLGDRSWSNGLDWEDAATIDEYEVEGERADRPEGSQT